MATQNRLLLVDSHALIHRAYHALPDLRSGRGAPSGALYGLGQTLLRLLETLSPSHAVAALDRPEPVFRRALYADYKAHRPPLAPDLAAQIARIPELVGALGIITCGLPGYEADDVIATLATRGRALGFEVAIVTGDRDLLQLVGDGVTVYLPGKNFSDLLSCGEAEVRARYGGLGPGQIPDYKALCGDASDNIPGVPGVGDKTATRLLLAHESLDRLLDSLDTLEPKVRARLAPYAEQARLARRLATVERAAPLDLDLTACRWQGPDRVAAQRVFADLGFKRLLRRVVPAEEPPLLQLFDAGSPEDA